MERVRDCVLLLVLVVALAVVVVQGLVQILVQVAVEIPAKVAVVLGVLVDVPVARHAMVIAPVAVLDVLARVVEAVLLVILDACKVVRQDVLDAMLLVWVAV